MVQYGSRMCYRWSHKTLQGIINMSEFLYKWWLLGTYYIRRYPHYFTMVTWLLSPFTRSLLLSKYIFKDGLGHYCRLFSSFWVVKYRQVSVWRKPFERSSLNATFDRKLSHTRTVMYQVCLRREYSTLVGGHNEVCIFGTCCRLSWSNTWTIDF